MSTRRVKFHDGGTAILTYAANFEPGDQPPPSSYYHDWQEWAEVQHKAGLRQKECGRCGKWKYPQELSGTIDTHRPVDRLGRPVEVRYPVCNKCLELKP